jgi:hypothetical protein
MPFESEAQRRFMWSQHPDIAQRWSDKYGTGKGLPYHKRKSKRSASRKKKRQ